MKLAGMNSTYSLMSLSRFLNRHFIVLLFIFAFPPLIWADVVINEIMYNAKVDEENSEYIELFNTSVDPVDLTGWLIHGGIEFVLPPFTVLEGQSYLLVCRNELAIRSQYNITSNLLTIGNYAPTRLSNSGEEIRLEDHAGNVVDVVRYRDSTPWPPAADGGGASLELVNPQVDNNSAMYWSAGGSPTPGRVNSRYAPQAPPRPQFVTNLPQSPSSQDTVTVLARFAPDDNLQTVNLTYQVNGSGLQALPMTLQNGHYSAIIPAQSAGSLVEYWVSAVNASGYQIILPAGTFESRYLYKVDSSPVAAGSVLIHEIMYNNPTSGDEDREWIELYNATDREIDLSHWLLQDANDLNGYRLPQGTKIAAQGYLLIAHVQEAGWTASAVTGLTFSLGDDGDDVRLMDPNQRLISSVEFSDEGEWPNGADGLGRSLELIQVSRPNRESNNWTISPIGGTPGRANAGAVTDPAYHDFDVVINELFYHPNDEEYDDNIEKEYIELYNRSAQPVDLSGWRFTQGVEFLFPQGTTLPGQGYLLVCRNKSHYSTVANKIGNYTLQLSNGGEAVALTNDAGVVIDYVPYRDDFPWPAMPDGRGQSLELIAPNADNRVAQVWRNGQPNSPGISNAVILPNAPPRITNVRHIPEFPSASTSESRTETVQIIKDGDLWRYAKGNVAPPSNWKDPGFNDSGWQEGPGGFGYGDNDDRTTFSDMRYSYTSIYIRKTFQLSQTPNDSQLILRVNYDDGFVAYLNGVEVVRGNVNAGPIDNNTLPNPNHEAGSPETFDISNFAGQLREGENVLAIQGMNDSLDSSDLSLNPDLTLVKTLSSGGDRSDTVVITAKVQDSDGLAEVKVHFQRLITPLGTGLVQGEWGFGFMYDDGTHGDAVAGDSVYSFTLNDVEAVRPGEIWRYKFSAKDKTGQEAALPLPDEEVRNFALFVENKLDQSNYPTLYLFMERRVLDWLTRNPESDIEQQCLVVIDGEVFDLYHGGGIRYRGHVLRNKPKKSWKIQFAKGKYWNNQRTINLNSNYQTSPLVRGESGFMEQLAYQLFREVGIPTPNTNPCRVILNNSYYGLFIQIEQYNQDFLDNHALPEETQIYKAGLKAIPTYMSREPNFNAYAQKYENSIGREKDIQQLIDFIESMHAAVDLKAFFEAHVNVEDYITYLAALAVLSHVDATEKNYFPMKQVDGRWQVLPWDISHAWGEMFDINAFPFKTDYSLLDGAEGGKFGTNILRQKFLRVPEFRKRYYERLRDFTTHNFTHEHWDSRFDAYWNYLKPAIDEDDVRWDNPGNLTAMVPEMKKYITGRIAFILRDPNVVPATLPAKPLNEFPAANGVVANRTLNLSVKNTASGPFAAAEWELNSGLKDFHKPTWMAEKTSNAWPFLEVPAGVLASNSTYYWRMRWKQNASDAWSDWSDSTSFTTLSDLPSPEVQNLVVTPMDGSVRLEWDLPAASDLLRVDIFDGARIVESAPIHDNRVRIANLMNGQEYIFTLRVVTADRQSSPGVTVKATPRAALQPGQTIAYFRFEGQGIDDTGRFTGERLGNASISAPGAENPLTGAGSENKSSLLIGGAAGSGFRFGSTEIELDALDELTVECFAQFSGSAEPPVVLVDRYDEISTDGRAVWRFGLNLSSPGSIDFFLNDADSASGLNGRLHIATVAQIVPQDGRFHHYAAVVDLGENAIMNKVRLYLDGFEMKRILINEDGISDYDRLRSATGLPVYIGARRSGAGTADVFPGRLDEVRLVNAQLQPSQFLHPPDESTSIDWALY